MKKVLYFLAGIIFTIAVAGGIIYYWFSTNVTVAGETSESSLISEETVEEALATKIIDRISIAQYDAITQATTTKTMVNFWASWCESCLKEIPTLKEYAASRNINLIFVNFDKVTIAQNKVVLDKMKKLNIDKTYQLMGDDKLIDPFNHRMLGSFLKDRNIKMDTLGLPINLIYENGVNTHFFGPTQMENLLFQGLDNYVKEH
ncbi:TlpA family protein disulfide reductase [Myroides sp. NP-2]|uniref:TlpA disulfide reductase family protein n=1 Tax=Myroides sp. NP-2 TaxID=2759945 RepID=UPI0015FAE18C|nr:TlpA disulfide reductase family protein [Myroides sp. NP-2]MBB1150734.1 TlpA family protein disulfide reductase [Myroides sp. NP-2]